MQFEEDQNSLKLSSLNIAIVGLGLMGGSLAMALKGSAKKLIGLDSDGESCQTALRLGIIDENTARIDDGISNADLIVLAVPVQGIIALLQGLPALKPDGCMVLDLGSTKREIGLAMEGLPENFSAIGGHPMCGRERSGIAAASADLFQDETFILCRNARTTAGIEAAALALVQQIGARALFMPAIAHDELVAASSHLPYVVSAVLMGRAWEKAADDHRLWQVSASGLRDTTRLAGSSPEMMLEIMLTNRLPLLAQIDAYGRELATIADALRRQDETALHDILAAVARQRAAYLREKYGQGDSSTGGSAT